MVDLEHRIKILKKLLTFQCWKMKNRGHRRADYNFEKTAEFKKKTATETTTKI